MCVGGGRLDRAKQQKTQVQSRGILFFVRIKEQKEITTGKKRCADFYKHFDNNQNKSIQTCVVLIYFLWWKVENKYISLYLFYLVCFMLFS